MGSVRAKVSRIAVLATGRDGPEFVKDRGAHGLVGWGRGGDEVLGLSCWVKEMKWRGRSCLGEGGMDFGQGFGGGLDDVVDTVIDCDAVGGRVVEGILVRVGDAGVDVEMVWLC